MEPQSVALDPTLRCQEAIDFEKELSRRVVGQPEAVAKTVEVMQVFMAGLNPPDRPVGNLLFLGPTGTGKTRSLRPAGRQKPRACTRGRRHCREHDVGTTMPSTPVCRSPACFRRRR